MSVTERALSVTTVRDVEPDIPRHRAIIEGRRTQVTDDKQIIAFLTELVDRIGMTLVEPVTASNCDHGHPGWSAWAEAIPARRGLAYITTSSIVLHEYRLPGRALVTVDLYSCRPFSLADAVAFTNETFAFEDVVSWQVPGPSGPGE
jgi:hypothetical protein